MAFCTKCGARLEDGAKFCPKCGAPVNEQQASAQSTPFYQVNQNSTAVKQSDRGHGLAVGSLVCGIIGVVCWFFGYGSFLSIILGIVGLVLAGNARNAGNTDGTRTAGFVLSIISLIGGCIVFLYMVVAFAFLGATLQGIFDFLR